MVASPFVLAAIALSLWQPPTPQPHLPDIPVTPPPNDTRADFQALAWMGVAVDTFAAGEVTAVLNPTQIGTGKLRGVGGFEFQYRLAQSLWVHTQTRHGVRSTDILCGTGNVNPTCQSLPQPPTGANILTIIRDASTLEANMGIRWEFATLRSGHPTPAALYVDGTYGLAVSSDPNSTSDAADIATLAIGVMATNGPFHGTYLQIGWGRNDLFSIRRTNRLNLQGMMRIHLPLGMQFFVAMTVDTDLGFGSDSIQTYYGLGMDPVKLIWR